MNAFPASGHGGDQAVGDAAADIDVMEAYSGALHPSHDAAGQLRVLIPPRRDRRLGTDGTAGVPAPISGKSAAPDISPWQTGVAGDPTAPASLALAADAPRDRESVAVICGCRDHGDHEP